MEELYQKRIEAYLNNEMNEAEQQSFEQDCEQDSVLLNQLKTEIKLRYSVKEAVKEVHHERIDVDNPRRLSLTERPLLSLLIAATILLMIIATVILILEPDSQTDMQGLYAEYVDIAPVENFRTGEETDSLWAEAVSAYQNKNWERSEELLQNFMQMHEDSFPPQAPLLLAISHLQQSETDEAMSNLIAISSQEHPFYFDAIWYRMLIHLLREEVDQAKELLVILQSSRKYRERANKILLEVDARQS